MIWFTIGLFAVSFLVTALLAPKPELENARAQDLDPNSFPQASENSPIPLVLGRARVNGPNTLYYGNFSAVPIREKVKTGLFSSTTITKGYKYYLTADMGICLGPSVGLKDIYVDEEAIEAGTETNIIPEYDYYTCDEGGTETWNQTSFFSDNGLPMCATPYYGAQSPNSGDGVEIKNIESDMGLDLAVVDGGQLNVTAQLGGIAAGNQGFDWSFFLEIKFWDDIDGPDGTGSELYAVEGIGAMNTGSTAAPGVTHYCNLDVTLPAGTRSVSLHSHFSYLFPIFASAAFGDSELKIEGEFIDHSSKDWAIYEPELFGGDENGGGLIGDYTFYSGAFNLTDQPVDTHLEELEGAGNVPAYLGVSHAVFENLYIGESPNMRKMAFDVCVYPTNLATVLTDASDVRIGDDDINPAEALYEILTNNWRGLNIPTSLIDTDSFAEAGDTLAGENFGISVIISGAQNGKKAVSEILRTIDGIMYQDPTTGKFVLKLIREDYVAASLTIEDEASIVRVRNLSKTAWEDVVSEVKVSFNSRTSEDGRIALAQDMAVANMLGRRKTSTVSYPLVYDPAVANVIASRELSQLSVPLLKFELEMNRNGYSVKPGDVFKVSWPEYGLSEVIVRASSYDTGELLNNKIVIECVEDKFGVGTVVFADPAESAWSDPVPLPNDIIDALIVEMPYFMASSLEYPTEDGFGNIIPFPVNPDSTESTQFTMRAGVVTGTLDIVEPKRENYPATGLLSEQYGRTAGFETGVDATGFTITTTIGTPEAATATQIAEGEGGLIYVDGEWMGYEGVTDNGSGSFTLDNIHRGLMGTRPKTHAAATRVYFYNANLIGTGILGDVLVEDGTAFYKLLDIAGDISQDPGAITESSFDLADIADRPLRPRNLQIDSNARAAVPYDAASDPTFTVSWAPDDRTAETIPDEVDAAGTPDQTEEYDLQVWIDGVDESATFGATSIAGTSQAVDVSSATGSSGEIRVISRRTGGDTKESVHYAFYPFTLAQAKMDSTTVTMDDSGTTMDQTE